MRSLLLIATVALLTGCSGRTAYHTIATYAPGEPPMEFVVNRAGHYRVAYQRSVDAAFQPVPGLATRARLGQRLGLSMDPSNGLTASVADRRVEVIIGSDTASVARLAWQRVENIDPLIKPEFFKLWDFDRPMRLEIEGPASSNGEP